LVVLACSWPTVHDTSMSSTREYTTETIAATLERIDPERSFIYMGSAALVMQLFTDGQVLPKPFHDLDIDALAPREIVDNYTKDGHLNPHITYHSHTMYAEDPLTPTVQLFEGIDDEYFFINYISASLEKLSTLPSGHRALTVEEIIHQKLQLGRPRDIAQIACVLTLMPSRIGNSSEVLTRLRSLTAKS